VERSYDGFEPSEFVVPSLNLSFRSMSSFSFNLCFWISSMFSWLSWTSRWTASRVASSS